MDQTEDEAIRGRGHAREIGSVNYMTERSEVEGKDSHTGISERDCSQGQRVELEEEFDVVFPEQRQHQLPLAQQFRIFHHPGYVTCCALFEDGTSRVLSGDSRGALRLWICAVEDEGDNEHVGRAALCVVHAHARGVYFCAISSDGKRATSGGTRDGNVNVYRVTDRQLLLLHTFLAKDDGRGWSCWTGCQLLFVSATRAIAKSNSKGTFKVWDVETCEELGCLACETRWYPPVMCCDVFANDTRAIAGRIDGQLAVWDLNNGVFREDFVLRSHSAAVTCCAAFEGGTKAISGGKDSVLKVWDLVYRVELVTLRGHKDVVWCCSVLPTGERAVSGSFDRTVKVWDTGTGWLQHTISQHTHFVWCCALAASGSILVSGSCDGTLQYRPLPTDDGESSPKPRVSVGESAPPREGSFRHARVTLDSSVS